MNCCFLIFTISLLEITFNERFFYPNIHHSLFFSCSHQNQITYLKNTKGGEINKVKYNTKNFIEIEGSENWIYKNYGKRGLSSL